MPPKGSGDFDKLRDLARTSPDQLYRVRYWHLSSFPVRPRSNEMRVASGKLSVNDDGVVCISFDDHVVRLAEGVHGIGIYFKESERSLRSASGSRASSQRRPSQPRAEAEEDHIQWDDEWSQVADTVRSSGATVEQIRDFLHSQFAPEAVSQRLTGLSDLVKARCDDNDDRCKAIETGINNVLEILHQLANCAGDQAAAPAPAAAKGPAAPAAKGPVTPVVVQGKSAPLAPPPAGNDGDPRREAELPRMKTDFAKSDLENKTLKGWWCLSPDDTSCIVPREADWKDSRYQFLLPHYFMGTPGVHQEVWALFSTLTMENLTERWTTCFRNWADSVPADFDKRKESQEIYTEELSLAIAGVRGQLSLYEERGRPPTDRMEWIFLFRSIFMCCSVVAYKRDDRKTKLTLLRQWENISNSSGIHLNKMKAIVKAFHTAP